MVNPEQILGLFPDFMRGMWEEAAGEAKSLQEIRLRADKPVKIGRAHV